MRNRVAMVLTLAVLALVVVKVCVGCHIWNKEEVVDSKAGVICVENVVIRNNYAFTRLYSLQGVL